MAASRLLDGKDLLEEIAELGRRHIGLALLDIVNLLIIIRIHADGILPHLLAQLFNRHPLGFYRLVDEFFLVKGLLLGDLPPVISCLDIVMRLKNTLSVLVISVKNRLEIANRPLEDVDAFFKTLVDVFGY